MSEDNLNNNNNNMAIPPAGRESLEMVKTVGTGETLSILILTQMVMVYLGTESYWCRPSVVFSNDSHMVLCV